MTRRTTPTLKQDNACLDDTAPLYYHRPGTGVMTELSCCYCARRFERVADDAPVPGTMTGYWLDTALKQDNAACLDGTAPLYYHRPGTGTGKDKWYIHHEGTV